MSRATQRLSYESDEGELYRLPMVRHVGEAIAIIVGESRNQAEDAAELVTSDFEELPAVVDPEAALQHGDVVATRDRRRAKRSLR